MHAAISHLDFQLLFALLSVSSQVLTCRLVGDGVRRKAQSCLRHTNLITEMSLWGGILSLVSVFWVSGYLNKREYLGVVRGGDFIKKCGTGVIHSSREYWEW